MKNDEHGEPVKVKLNEILTIMTIPSFLTVGKHINNVHDHVIVGSMSINDNFNSKINSDLF